MKTIAALLLSAVSLHADTLGDMKTAVAALHGTQPIRAAVEIHRKDNDAGRFSNDHFEATATVNAGVDANGVHLDFAPALVETFLREQRDFAANPKKTPATSRTAGSITPLWALDRLNASDAFLGMLSHATLKSEARAIFQKRPARLLLFEMKEIVPAGAISLGSVNYPVNRLQVYVGDDNLPLFAEHTIERDAKFMFMHGRSHETNTWSYARVSDRLIITRHVEITSAEGLGQKGSVERSETVTVLN